MTSFDSKSLSVVVSGGSDTTPMVTPLREYGRENIRGLSNLPSEAPVASAPKARLLVAWWDKDIYIWRIARQHKLEALPEQQRSRRLVAKITLDIRDKLRNVSISPDGKLLAASTTSEVKAFQLRKKLDADGLAVRKLEVPDDLADSGARLLCFSPDSKWLAAVTPESEIQVVRFAPVLEKPKHLYIIDRVVELDRQKRKSLQQSAYKTYECAVTRMTFNSESSILVTSDLSGFVDSWVLEGHEDLTALVLDLAKHGSDDGSSDDSSDSDSSSDDDDDAIAVFHGQHWTDNPSGHLVPKLDSAPLVLSFRPSGIASQTSALTNGNPGVHATRHNPHAHSHVLPQGQHKLFVITAKHQMYELDILAGKLSDWSRRNPTAVLPEDFTKIRDRAMGAIWDVSSRRERVWLYGSTWVFMLNVGRDLEDNSKAVARKRRPSEAEDDTTPKRLKGTSGAGSRLPASQRTGAGALGSIKVTSNGVTKTLDAEHSVKREADDDEDVDMLDDEPADLRLTRMESRDEQEVDGEGDGERKWWGTFKYRPILGMVPLEDEDAGEDGVLEVVIVERPLDRGAVQKKKR